jgi:hypothetical protein
MGSASFIACVEVELDFISPFVSGGSNSGGDTSLFKELKKNQEETRMRRIII